MSKTLEDKTTVPDNSFSNQDLESIRIPDVVRSIRNNEFKDCKKLKTVILPDGLIKIGNNAFEGCINLKEIIIPSTVTSIGDNAFNNCPSLNIYLEHNHIKALGKNAFGGHNPHFLIREDAINNYRLGIRNLFDRDSQIYSEVGLPFQIRAYFGGLYDDGTITAKELEIDYRLNKLLACFNYKKLEDSSDDAQKYIKKSYYYENDKFEIAIIKKDDEIILEILTDEGYYLKTNSFIFNKNQTYYFHSKWEVIIGPGLYNLGEIKEIHLKV